MNNKYALIVCLMVSTCLVKAQTFTEVIINQWGASFPNQIVPFNDSLFFSATDSTYGYEPWVSGGSSGAQLTDDIFVGPGNSFPQYFTADSNLFLFFQANDSVHGQELWANNVAGTYLVKDIYPGTSPSLPQNLYVFNHKLYFQADDGVHGPELWVSDGTSAGTQLVTNINLANGDSAGAFPSCFTAYNGKLYFNATDSIHGYELWVTDGTAGGTMLVSDIYPGTYSSNPTGLTVFNGKLYFSATDSVHGTELWVSDGTNAGTQLVSDISPGYQSSNPQGFTVLGSQLIFQADDGVHGPELWVTNGSTNGTQLLADIYSGPTGSYPQSFTLYQGKLFFQATDSLHGAELWTTDGTNSGTALLADINPGLNGSYPAYFTSYHNNLYFSAQPDSVSGAELFFTNGTANGTNGIILTDGPLNPLGNTTGFTVLGNNLAFSAFYDVNAGQQLWYFNDAPSAVIQINAKPAFTLYPNPCKDYYTISGFNIGETYAIRLTDITGRILQQQQIQASAPAVQFLTPAVSPGIYLLEVQSGQNISTLRMVKGQ
jgi:ELWxxDGT repeat protein